MFFELKSKIQKIGLVFLAVLMVIISFTGNPGSRDISGIPGKITVDSAEWSDRTFAQLESTQFLEFNDEKDAQSSLNSVNLIIYMIYKVTNKSIK
jgi:hypothetical protein